MQGEKRGLGEQVMSGAAWVGAGRLGVRLISIVSTLILVRLLAPEDFGLVAVAMAFVGVLSQMSDFGFNAALIRFQDATREDYATAWTLNVARSVLVSGLLFALSGPIAAFYGDQRLEALIAVVAVIPLVSGFTNVRLIDFEKGMDFRPLSALMVVVKLVAFATTITVALLTRSYWALIAGTIVAQVVRLGLTYWLVPFRPWPTLASWRRLLGFSGWLLGANFLQALNMRADEAVLQKLVATQGVGIFFVAKDLVRTPMQEVIAPVRRALFPGLSRLSPGEPGFHRAYFGTVAGLFMIVAPMGLGVALVADEAVPLLLGAAWSEAVVPMQIFGLQMAITVLGQAAIAGAMASGNTRMWFNRNLVITPIRFGLLIAGALYGGVNGAVAALFVAGMISTGLNIAMANRVVGSSHWDHVRPCWRTWSAAALLVCTLGGADLMLPAASTLGLLELGVRLTVQVVLGAAVYTLAHLGLWLAAGRPHGPEARLLELLARRRPGAVLRRQHTGR